MGWADGMDRSGWTPARATHHPTGSVSARLDLDAPEWMDRALCAQVDYEMFFPEKGGSTADAKRLCGTCDVREDCLRYAIDHHERFGIWGGKSERERRAIAKAEAS